LAWRLAIAIREKSKNYDRLLSGWFHERAQQLQVSLAKTISNGRLCTQGNTWKFLFTKLFLRVMQFFPSLNRKLEKGPRIEGMIRYKWQKGLPFVGSSYGGLSLPQLYCAPFSSSLKSPEVSLTDDVIFGKDKKGLFQLLVLLRSPTDASRVRNTLASLDKRSGRYIIPSEATFLVQSLKVSVVPADIGNNVFRLATADEFAATESLCGSRPKPQYYDENQISSDLHGKTFIIVRPDRFVYAACDTLEELQTICGGIQHTLGLL
jgi:hypothetical protein